MSRDATVLPRKLDWMVMDRADELRTIMSDNATYIQLPPLGSSTSLLTIFGDHRVTVEPRLAEAIDKAATLAEAGEAIGQSIGAGAVLVTGSVVTVGEARALLKGRR